MQSTPSLSTQENIMTTLTIKDLAGTAREMDRTEMADISGGMIDTGYRPRTPTDDGVTWVPEGTVKVTLAGVEQPSHYGG
jgi:hypothetical protein